ncbi:SpoIIE family protein phosphatase [Streptomyces sp. NPDC001380]|uniref:SpoIIE family protein phosphatase n=1 Tax=Streptomyces sp. NPDC001380 TaxID=3364566 RepID=UPI0036D0CB6B
MAADPAPQQRAADAGVTAAPGGLLDLLRVAAVVLDSDGRIALWSPEAEQVFGFTAAEALGRYAARLFVAPENRQLAMTLFGRVRAGAVWAGVFPVRHRDGSDRQVEFRTMRLVDRGGGVLALGLAADVSTVRRVETDMALSERLVEQSPVGVGVFDTGLRFVRVNAALAGLAGRPAAALLGLTPGEALPSADADEVESALRRVLATGRPVLDQRVSGGPQDETGRDHVWSVCHYRLDDSTGRVLGLAVSVIDVSERHWASAEAVEARERLAVIADAGVRIGTTLDLQQTARELAQVAVPRLADLAAVDILDSVLGDTDDPFGSATAADGSTRFRALAVAAGYPTQAIHAADPVGAIAHYDPSRTISTAVREARPVLVPLTEGPLMGEVARDEEAAGVLARAGVHSYLAVPLTARGEVLGTLSLYRTVTPRAFGRQDETLACELAARAGVCIDNARLYGRERETALTLQRSLLPQEPAAHTALETATRYRPAAAGREIGGDWFDVLPLADGKVALVVGDVMGSGVRAAAVMGQLRIATRALAGLDLAPADLLAHLDDIAAGLGDSFATCVYAVCDPRRSRCEISSAGHLPPVRVLPDGRAALVEIPVAAPLGVGGVPFSSVTVDTADGTLLALYTDGLVERRDRPIDSGLRELLCLLEGPARPLQETCDTVLDALYRSPDDDVALLLARLGGGTAAL